MLFNSEFKLVFGVGIRCMLLGHHLRGLEYLLELMQLFRESVKVETISQEGDNDARELQTTLIFSVGRRRLFDEPSMTLIRQG